MVADPEGPRAAAWAVTSGKGGVGKSTIALNLGIALSSLGRRVLLIDADLGLANIDILLGVTPEHNLDDLLRGRAGAFDVIAEGPEGLTVLPAATGLGEGDAWQPADRARLAEELGRLERGFDLILLDTGAGISSKVTDFVLSSDRAFVVVVPEPTSIADAYAMVKVCRGRRPDLPFSLIVNHARSAREARDLHEKFNEVTDRFLGLRVDRAGFILEDAIVEAASRGQRPFILSQPRSEAGRCIRRIAEDLLPRIDREDRTGPGLFVRLMAETLETGPLEPTA